MKTEIVSFDADGTVVDNSFVNEFWFGELPRLYAQKQGINLEQAVETLSTYYDQVGDEDLRWYQPGYWFEEFGLSDNPTSVIKKIKKNHDLNIYKDAIEVINKLNRQYKLIVISNSPRIFLDFSLKEVEDKFDKIYSCVSDFGMVKKDERVYKRVIEELETDPGKVLHVGDHWKFDYKVPKSLGIKTFFINRDNNTQPGEDSEVITDLREILFAIT